MLFTIYSSEGDEVLSVKVARRLRITYQGAMEKVKKRHGVNSYRREVECALQATTGYKLRTCMEKENKKRGGPKVM